MIQTRVIPCLLLKEGGLVKTIKFKNPNYIGDPINAVKIFNEKEVDELIFLDITASKEKRDPNFDLLSDIATECFMPFAYGGGVNNMESIHKLLRLGVEKVILNTAAFEKPELVKEATAKFGSSTIIGAMDVKRNLFGGFSICIRDGSKCSKLDPVQYAMQLESNGIGEIFINSIDRDGMMNGYDIELIKNIAQNVNVPVIACGGAGNLEDIKEVIAQTHISAAASGSLFVYFGKKKGILINYPMREDIDKII